MVANHLAREFRDRESVDRGTASLQNVRVRELGTPVPSSAVNVGFLFQCFL